MSARLSITFLLIASITTPSLSYAQTAEDSPAAGQERKLTPEEQWAALDLAARFTKRLRVANDFGPIVDEMFVRDFPGRLHGAPQDRLPWLLIDKDLNAGASPSELRRFYVAALNFYQLFFRLYEEAARRKKQEEGEEAELEFEEILSPEVVSVVLSNPTFAELAELDKEGKSDESAKEDNGSQPSQGGDSEQAAGAAAESSNDRPAEKNEIGIIKTLKQLNDASATLEKAATLMSARLASLSGAAQPTAEEQDAESEEEDSPTPHWTTLDEGEFGYSKGTPVVHLDVLPYCMELIKIDGEFKILSVTIYVD